MRKLYLILFLLLAGSSVAGTTIGAPVTLATTAFAQMSVTMNPSRSVGVSISGLAAAATLISNSTVGY